MGRMTHYSRELARRQAFAQPERCGYSQFRLDRIVWPLVSREAQGALSVSLRFTHPSASSLADYPEDDG